MTFGAALALCLRKSLVFSGRASRTEFWKFFPFGIGLPCIATVFMLALGFPLPLAALVFLATALPLFAVGSRRLQDTGEHGAQAVWPWAEAFGSVIFGWLAFKCHVALHTAFSGPEPLDGPTGFGVAFSLGPAKWICLLTALVLAFRFVATVTPALGQCLVRGQPDTNQYGPVPLGGAA